LEYGVIDTVLRARAEPIAVNRLLMVSSPAASTTTSGADRAPPFLGASPPVAAAPTTSDWFLYAYQPPAAAAAMSRHRAICFQDFIQLSGEVCRRPDGPRIRNHYVGRGKCQQIVSE